MSITTQKVAANIAQNFQQPNSTRLTAAETVRRQMFSGLSSQKKSAFGETGPFTSPVRFADGDQQKGGGKNFFG